MPNWCSTNYAIRGEKSELKEFAGIINSLPQKESVHENSFGPFWLGNLIAALGDDWGKYPCKGAVDPNPDSPAYFFGPCPDEEEEVEPADGFLRFSMTTAYNRSQEIEDLIKSRFPSFEFFWRSTDDCGNFSVINDPDDEAGFDWFYLNDGRDSMWYEKKDSDRFLKDLRATCPGLDIPNDLTENECSYDSFVCSFCEWRDSDASRDDIEFGIFFQIDLQ